MAVPTPLVFLASVAIAVLLLWRQGSLADLGAAARGASPVTLLAGTGLYVIGLVLLCLRWHALVLMVGGRSDPPLAAEAFLTSVVVNYAAPIGLAVPTRAALSARDLGLSAGAGGAVALWEVVLDLLVLGLLSLGWLVAGNAAVLRAVDGSAALLLLLAGVALGGSALVAFALARRPALRQRARLAVGELVRYPGRRPCAAWAALALTLGFWALQAVILRLLLGAVGLGGRADAGLVVGLLGPPILLGMLSPVPGGAGVREALMVAVAGARGVDGAAVLLAAVAYRVALVVAVPLLYLGVRLWRARRTTAAGRGERETHA